jgi:hypothetical protein
MSRRSRLTLTIATLAMLALKCRETSLAGVGDGGMQDGGDAGSDGGPDAGDGGRDGGRDAGDGGIDGGLDAGDAGHYPDAGTCRIPDAGLVQAGTWLDAIRSSCIYCDPELNPDGWTILDAGDACEFFMDSAPSGPRDQPFFGTCTGVFGDGFQCTVHAGPCRTDVACFAGYCDLDSGQCVMDENRGYETECSSGPPQSNLCAEGPCCLDAGIEGEPDGGGWCCGLVDGGVQICLDAGSVCYDSSDCCQGLNCVGNGAVLESATSYGFCR